MNRRQSIKKYVMLTLLIILAAASQTLSIKANIGVCACWDALSLNFYELFGIKVGTFSILANFVVVGIQLLVLRRDFHPSRFLQIGVAIIYGVVINFFYYHVLTFELTSYWMRMVFCLLSYVGLAVFIGGITLLNTLQIPVEGTCYVLYKKFGWDFAKIRMIWDGSVIAASILISLTCGLSLKIREGTILGMLILGPMMNWCMRHEENMTLFEDILPN